MNFRWTILGTLLVGLGACAGEIGGPPPDDLGQGSQPLCTNGPRPGPMPRFTRLTHAQYDNTIRDLIGLDLKPSAAFIADPDFAGFNNNAKGLVVSDRLARDYLRAAEDVATKVVSDAATLKKLLPCTPNGDDEACAKQFIQTFGRRAYRRPLASDTVDAYVKLYHEGTNLYATGTPFEQGIHLVLEGFLQSPDFLYRLELSSTVDTEATIPLDGFEVADRLSYLLWNSMPDDELLRAADAGELATASGIEKQARRLLDSPNASAPVDDFHYQWLQMSKYQDLQKDPKLFPQFQSPTMSASLKEEAQRFIRHVILEEKADYAKLFTESTGYVNADLAPIYGVSGQFGPDMKEVSLDPNERFGLLTEAGYLASRAYPNQDSPIHRGVFIQRQLLCFDIPPPPPGVNTKLPPFDGMIKTTRQAVEQHTSPPTCQACHGKFNPAGFAFESYDAIGAWRTEENGVTVDTTGSIPVGDHMMSFKDAKDLSTQIAASPEARRCYLKQWFRYGYARQEAPEDACTLAELDDLMTSSGYNVKELLVALTQTKTFRFRAVEEAGQ